MDAFTHTLFSFFFWHPSLHPTPCCWRSFELWSCRRHTFSLETFFRWACGCVWDCGYWARAKSYFCSSCSVRVTPGGEAANIFLLEAISRGASIPCPRSAISRVLLFYPVLNPGSATHCPIFWNTMLVVSLTGIELPHKSMFLCLCMALVNVFVVLRTNKSLPVKKASLSCSFTSTCKHARPRNYLCIKEHLKRPLTKISYRQAMTTSFCTVIANRAFVCFLAWRYLTVW